MKYVVELGYHNYYEFNDANTAVNFASIAYTNKAERKSYDYVSIHLKDDDWKEEDNGRL